MQTFNNYFTRCTKFKFKCALGKKGAREGGINTKPYLKAAASQCFRFHKSSQGNVRAKLSSVFCIKLTVGHIIVYSSYSLFDSIALFLGIST